MVCSVVAMVGGVGQACPELAHLVELLMAPLLTLVSSDSDETD